MNTRYPASGSVQRNQALRRPGSFLLWGSFALGIHVVPEQIAFMAGYVEVVLQLFLRIAAALTHGPHLLRGRSGVGVLVRAMVLNAVSAVLTHTEIVPPHGSVRKVSCPAKQKDDDGTSRRRPFALGAAPPGRRYPRVLLPVGREDVIEVIGTVDGTAPATGPAVTGEQQGLNNHNRFALA
ncbi:hypothetical protein ABIB27_003594 [Arthrobacter sp. UYEF21]